MYNQQSIIGSLGLTKLAQDNLYKSLTKVNLYVKNPVNDYDYEAQSTNVTFEINVEARSWGIKSMYINVVKIDPIEINVIDPESLDTINTIHVNVDANKLEQVTNQLPEFTIGEIDLVIDPNINVDYSTSQIEVCKAF